MGTTSIDELKREKGWRAMRSGEIYVVMQPA
jgi:hypothetical protein